MARDFAWPTTAAVLAELATCFEFQADDAGRWVGVDDRGRPRVRVSLPPCLAPARAGEDLESWRARQPRQLGTELVILLQAGAAAVGLWHADREIHHRVFKRYVKRGHGKAQPTHLSRKGKSRYGSRLRLQNHAKLLDEVAERLTAWQVEQGAADVIWRSAVDRRWAELCTNRPAPPFVVRDPRIRRVPLHVHEPGLEELRRVRRALTHGRVEVLDDDRPPISVDS